MSRLSGDELASDGSVLNGFDYELQVWVVDGVCTDVGIGKQYAGMRVSQALLEKQGKEYLEAKDGIPF